MTVTNICFHGIGSPEARPEHEAAYWVETDTFRRILDLIAQRPRVRISFDDGFASDVEIALPELRERGLTAAFFPIAGRLGRSGSLDGEDLRRLRDAGMTVGSHGMRHIPWRGLTGPELRTELITARDLIAAEIDLPVTEAACPLGRYDRSVLHALRSTGYTRVYTSDRALARSEGWLQPRFTVRAGDEPSEIWQMMEHRRRRLRRASDAVRIRIKSLR